MEFVRELFWQDNEVVMQLSVARSEHLSFHNFCLHMWKPLGQKIPLPPSLAVAPKTREEMAQYVKNISG